MNAPKIRTAFALLALILAGSPVQAESRVVWTEDARNRTKTLYQGDEVVQTWTFRKKPPGTRELEAAFDRRDLTAVETLLEAGLSGDRRDREGRTRLYRAAEDGDLELVELLLEQGVLLDRTDHLWGMTALDIAVFEGHDDIVARLIDAGAERRYHHNPRNIDEEEFYGC